MKNIIFKNRWIQIVYGALLMVAGILTIVFAVYNTSNLTNAISIIVAVCCFILGIVYIASSFASETKVLFPASLLFASVCIAIGVLLCVMPQLLGSVIVYFVAALMTVYGVVSIIKAISFILIKAKKWHIALFFIIGAILTVLGILAFVYKDKAGIVIYIGCGLVVAVYGVVEIVVAVKQMIKANKAKEEKATTTQDESTKKRKLLGFKRKHKEEKKEEIIDAEVEEVKKGDEPEVIDKTNE